MSSTGVKQGLDFRRWNQKGEICIHWEKGWGVSGDCNRLRRPVAGLSEEGATGIENGHLVQEESLRENRDAWGVPREDKAVAVPESWREEVCQPQPSRIRNPDLNSPKPNNRNSARVTCRCGAAQAAAVDQVTQTASPLEPDYPPQ